MRSTVGYPPMRAPGFVLALATLAALGLGCGDGAPDRSVVPDRVARQRSSDAGPATDIRMFRGDPEKTGVVETEGLPYLGALAWRFETGGPVRSTPAVAGGVVHVGSADGRLYAIDATDGSLLWVYEAGGPVNSSPAVTDRWVLVGDRTNTLHAVDRATGSSGWTVDLGPDLPLDWGREGWDYLGASPVLVPDPARSGAELVLFGSGSGIVAAFEAETGAERWRVPTTGRVRASAAVSEGTVYIGGGDGVVYALDLVDGTERWRFETTGTGLVSADFGFDRRQIQGSAAVANGIVYVGSRDASLYALDAATGELQWHLEDGSAWVVASPAVRNGVVFSGRSSSTRFRAIDAARGEELWVVTTGGPVFASPTVVGDLVYVASGNGSVYAFEAATGRQRWRFATGRGIHSSPVVTDGRLYVGSDDGYVYALAAGDEPEPLRAVYFDESLVGRAIWGGQPHHRVALEYFRRLGYRVLDAPGLADFLGERIADRRPSAIVFAMDALPREVTAGPNATDSPSDRSLFRRYLESHGKLVWMGYPPEILRRDREGQVTGVDREGAGHLLGIDLDAWDSDLYGAQPTAAGLRWGLTLWTVASAAAAAADVETVLAIDEIGRAVAFAHGYGGPEGTGFVLVPTTTDRDRLDEIRSLVDFGLVSGMKPPTP